jgi:hypothetical protein
MELELHYLRLVEAIAVEGAMTRAAVRLYITQSALSHQLAGLEEALGVSLFFLLSLPPRPRRACALLPIGDSRASASGREHHCRHSKAAFAGEGALPFDSNISRE